MRRWRDFLPRLKAKNCIFVTLGGMILAFGLFNVHSHAGVTEGGTLGLSLLLDRWLALSPAISTPIMNGICYLIGWRVLGRDFIGYSAVSCVSFAVFYAIFDAIGPLFPFISHSRLIAALLGALFVGVGVGVCVRFGGAPCGDDALAMSISAKTRLGISWVYLISDLTVLLLSLSYIPLGEIAYSLLTVVLSGQIIGFISSFRKKRV